MRRTYAVVGLAAAAALLSVVAGDAPRASAAKAKLPFEELDMFFEQNSTDGDAEAVISAQGGEGLARFRVFDPNGKKIIDVGSKGKNNIGLAHIDLESGEPDIDSVKVAYPEGTYRFEGRTIGGALLSGEVAFTHDLLDPPAVLTPGDGATNVNANANVLIDWSAVAGADGYVVEVEAEDDEIEGTLTVELSADVTSFTLAPGFLQPDVEYQLGLRTVSEEGNVNVAETNFTTSP